jgi:PAN domain
VEARYHRCSTRSGATSAAVGNALLDVVSAGNPRLFMQIADDAQRPVAERLRMLLQATTLSGASIVAPGVEKVSQSVQTIELRYLKAGDKNEANKLAGVLTSLTGQPVTVRDLSGQYETRADVKSRTYELWYPASATIFRPFARENGVDRRGEDYFSGSLASVDSCEEKCWQDRGCKAYTFLEQGATPNNWEGPPGPFCWLKKSVPAAVPYAGMISGVKPN